MRKSRWFCMNKTIGFFIEKINFISRQENNMKKSIVFFTLI